MPKAPTTLLKKSSVMHSSKNGSRKKVTDAETNSVKVKSNSLHRDVVSNDNYTDIILSGIANKPESRMTAVEKMEIARSGVSKKDLENLKEAASLDYDELSKALSVTRATLINKKGEDKFNAALSERIVGLADIYSYGYSVFEDEEKFNKWMFQSNRALGGKSPYDLVDNQFGREEVRNVIGRIEYGVYS